MLGEAKRMTVEEKVAADKAADGNPALQRSRV
jgi:hypothetical protein